MLTFGIEVAADKIRLGHIRVSFCETAYSVLNAVSLMRLRYWDLKIVVFPNFKREIIIVFFRTLATVLVTKTRLRVLRVFFASLFLIFQHIFDFWETRLFFRLPLVDCSVLLHQLSFLNQRILEVYGLSSEGASLGRAARQAFAGLLQIHLRKRANYRELTVAVDFLWERLWY